MAKHTQTFPAVSRLLLFLETVLKIDQQVGGYISCALEFSSLHLLVASTKGMSCERQQSGAESVLSDDLSSEEEGERRILEKSSTGRCGECVRGLHSV